MHSEHGIGRSSAKELPALGLLLVLTLAALALRFTGIGALLPYRGFGDERIYTAQLTLLRLPPEARIGDSRYGFYPHLVPRIARLLESDAPRAAPRTLAEHLARASVDHLLIRRIVACLSVLAVPATYFLTRRLAGRGAALLAAALTATSLIVLWYSQEARPHGAAIGLFTSTVVACAWARRRADSISSLVAGGLAGLSIGVLQSGLLLLLPLCVAHAFPARGSRRAGLLRLALALVIPVVCIRVFYPFVFAAVQLPGHHLLGQAAMDLSIFDASGFVVLARSFASHDPLIAALVLGATAAWITRAVRERELQLFQGGGDRAIVLSFVLPYLLAFGLYAFTFARYLLPIMPFLACFAATELERLLAPKRGLFAACAIALVVLQAGAVSKLLALRTSEDTLAEAARWIRDHVDPERERALVLADIDLPLPRDAAALASVGASFDNTSFPWLHWQMQLEPDSIPKPVFGLDLLALWNPEQLGELYRLGIPGLAARGAQHLVVEGWDAHGRPRLAPVFADTSRREVRISPMETDDGDQRPMLVRDQDDEFTGETCWAWRMLHARALGPVIEIYRIP